MSDFALWLEGLGLSKYSEVLASHDIDLTVVPDLTEPDLEKLGLSLGHRHKLLAAAAKLSSVMTSSPVPPAQVQPASQPTPLSERRQVTVVFIDLVGSTALGSQLDPEDLISLLRRYRDACVAAIGKYDGYIAQYLGDGILVQVSVKYDFPVTRAVGTFMLGAAHALEGDIARALDQMEPCYEATFGYGFLGMLPGIIMAEALAGANRNRDALALVSGLLDRLRTPEEGIFVPELWRIRGELMLRESASDAPQAERHFGTAERVAAKQGAIVYRLRAGILLSRLLAEEGRREEARTALNRANADPLDEWEGPEIGIATQLRSELG